MKTLIIASLLLIANAANAIGCGGPGCPNEPKVCVIINGQVFCN